MRLIYTLVTLAASGYGLIYLADKNPDLRQKAEEFIDFRTTTALQTQWGYEQIIEMHQKTLLKEKGARFLDPELKFYPHLLLEVKYSEKNKTKEGYILWDQVDGEMILDTKDWSKTHGLADCILANTQPHEYKILQILSNKGNSADVATLLSKLELEMPVLEIMVRSCLKKNLITTAGTNKFRLHLENPKLPTQPLTKLNEQLTTKAHKRAQRAKSHFSKSKVERIAKTAFGENFSIRTSTEIYLPVYKVLVQTQGGATETYHFNGLTGKALPAGAFYQ